MKKNSCMTLILFSVFFILSSGAFSEGIPEPDMVLYGRITHGMDIVEEGEIEISLTPAGGGQSITFMDALDKHIGPEPNKIEYSYKVKIPVETVLPGMEPSPGVVVLSDEDVTYSRTITVHALEKVKTYYDTISFGPEEQRGDSERRDYNIRDYTVEEIVSVILGRESVKEKIDPNGDQILDVSDLIHCIKD